MRLISMRPGLLLAALSLAAFGLALPDAAVAKQAPMADVPIEVKLMPEAEPGTNILVVGARLPEGTSLPATVRLPLPAGAEVFWAGEITGGAPQDDLLREFTIVDGDGGRAVEFTVEETLTVQYDAVYGAMAVSGDNITTSMQWLQTVATGEITFGVRIPARNVDVRITPAPLGLPQFNQLGEALFILTPVRLEPGSEYAVSVTYRRADVDTGADAGSLLMPMLLGALAIAVVALAIVVLSQRNRMDADESADAEEIPAERP